MIQLLRPASPSCIVALRDGHLFRPAKLDGHGIHNLPFNAAAGDPSARFATAEDAIGYGRGVCADALAAGPATLFAVAALCLVTAALIAASFPPLLAGVLATPFGLAVFVFGIEGIDGRRRRPIAARTRSI